MANVSINSLIVHDWHYTGTTFTLRVFSDRSFVALDGSAVPGRGDANTFYREYTITVVGTDATIPVVTLASQTDAPNEKNARYMAYFYVDGVERDMFLASTLGAFQVPDTPVTTTWANLEQYNFGVSRRYYKDDNTYSALVIDQKIAAASIAGTVNATASQKGISRLSVAAVAPTDPVVAGDNDPRLTAIRRTLPYLFDGSVIVGKFVRMNGVNAELVPIDDSGGAIGIVTSGAPGSVVVQLVGAYSGAIIDGSASVGDYLQSSTSIPGAGHSVGATYPTSGQVLGRIIGLSPTVVDIFGTEVRATTEIYINVESYGASVSSTDNSSAINNAITAAQTLGIPVYFPRLYNVQSTILCTALGSTGTETYVSLVGRNPVRSGINWTGPTNGIALKITKNKFFEVSGFGVYNGGAKGTTTGISLTGPDDSGTQTLAGRLDTVLVQGFHFGVSAGQYTNHATSEMRYHTLVLFNNDTGWKNGSLNTLNHIFYMLLLGANGIGLDVNSGNAAVYGGSASQQSTADFVLSNAGTPFSVNDFRSEDGNRFMTVVASSSQHTTTVKNCLVSSISNVDQIAITTTGNTQLQVEESTINGKVQIGLSNGTSLLMRNSFVLGDTLVPFFVDTSSADQLGPKYVVEGNRFYTDSSWYPDESGQYLGVVRVPVWSIKKGQSASPPYMELNRIKMLAYGSGVAGKNLRLQEKFATSATKAVTFIKTITVSTSSGSGAVGNSAGDVNVADLGKKIVLVAADGSGGNVTGYVASIDSPAQFTVRVTGASGIGVTSGAITVNIGENEPDANYILTIGCSAQETISWSSKLTTGFTLTSSNATSTASCDIIVVR